MNEQSHFTIDIEKAKAAKARLEQEKQEREERMKQALETKDNFESEVLSRNRLFPTR